MKNRRQLLAETIDADTVAAWLRAHPSFLADNLPLYRALTPPVRVHGEALADHMVAMLRAERAHAARADAAIDARRAAAGLSTRVEAAVLALLRASDPLDCVTNELPGLLGVDAVALCVEHAWPGARSLPRGAVAVLLAGRDVVIRDQPEDAPLLHAEAADLARRDALARVPGHGPAALLALAARDPARLDGGQDAAALCFLGRAVAAALGR